ncbi:MAG: InlB B-repeat-containing protein [Kiritimatiellae bacterium]|nr:InlB B-repeat-containing protein [Kiritimatiellia bacterium]
MKKKSPALIAFLSVFAATVSLADSSETVAVIGDAELTISVSGTTSGTETMAKSSGQGYYSFRAEFNIVRASVAWTTEFTAPERSGYRFLGWYTMPADAASPEDVSVAGCTSRISASATVADADIAKGKMYDGDHVICPKYVRTVSVTYAVSPTAAGSVALTTDDGLYATEGRVAVGSTCSLQATPAAGYAFSNWQYGSSAQTANPYAFTASTSNAGKYTATFTGRVYRAILNSNGGSGGESSVSAQYASALPALASLPVRSGYEFDGYTDRSDGSGVKYYNASGTSAHVWDKSQDGTLYAVWSANSYPLELIPGVGISNISYRTGPAAAWTTVTASTTVYLPSGTKWYAFATAAPGYAYDDTSADRPKSGTMDASGAVFSPAAKLDGFKLKVSPNGGEYNGSSDLTTLNGRLKAGATNLNSIGVAEHTEMAFRGFFDYNNEMVYDSAGRNVKGTYWSAAYPGGLFQGDDDLTVYALWATIFHSVTFQDPSGSFGDVTVSVQKNHAATAPEWSRTGYTLKWDGDFSSVTRDMVVNALWTGSAYTVVFDANGGYGAMDPQDFGYDELQALEINEFIRVGHSFAGWATNAAGAVKYADGATVCNLTAHGGEVALYAKWSANAYTVVFDANGGSGAMNGQGFVYGSPQALAANRFTRTGYTFGGWALDASAAVAFAGGASVSNLTEEAGGEVTLYAKWEANSFAVKFDANGGAGEMADQTFVYDSGRKLRQNDFTRQGYAFAGWAKSSGGGAVYADGAPVSNLTATAGASVTLYAKWEANSYSVKFDANGGAGEMADQSFTYDMSQPLSPNAFTRTGYAFEGWATNRGAGVSHAGGASVRNLTAEPGGVVTLYAKWTANRYSVKFDANGGSGTMADRICVYDEASALPTNLYTRAGFAFVGWAAEKGGEVVYRDGANAPNLTAVAGGTVTLYAEWAPVPYTVKFEANGGAGEMADQDFVYGEAQALAENEFTGPGMSFEGWAVTAGGAVVYEDGATVSNLTRVAGGEVALYAKWSANGYTVFFEANGGEGAMDGQDFVYGSSQELAANQFTRTGYTFDGWAKKADGPVVHENRAVVSNLTEEANGVTALYAKWKPVSYTVKFDANGGAGEMANQDLTYDAPTAIKANALTCGVRTFAGWATNQTGEVVYEDGETVKNLAVADGALITFYAVWNEDYTVVFYGNGATTGKMENQLLRRGRPEKLSPNGYAIAGCTFIGWSTNGTDGAVYADRAEVVDLAGAGGTVTLYAEWATNTYTVEYHLLGGSGGPAVENHRYGVEWNLPATMPEKSLHDFLGWSNDVEKVIYSRSAVVSNLTEEAGAVFPLYAVWCRNVGEWSAALGCDNLKFEPDSEEGNWINRGTYIEHATNKTDALKCEIKEPGTITFMWRGGYNDEDEDGSTILRVSYPGGSTNLTSTQDMAWERFSIPIAETGEVSFRQYKYGSNSVFVSNLVWVAERSHVTFHDPAGVFDDEVQPVAKGAAAVAPAWSRVGHSLAWSPADFSSVMKDMTVESVWTPFGYAVRFDSNGGAGEMPDQALVYGSAAELSLNGFTKTGGAFAGWATNQTGEVVYEDGATVKNLTTNDNGVVTLWAVWSANAYTVTFDANGGEGAMSAQEFVYGESRKLRGCSFTRAGYGFGGWSATPDGAAAYADREVVSNLTAEAGGVAALYATWAPNGYSVVFNANGGEGGMAAQDFEYGKAQKMRGNAFTREGYTFTGWSDSAAGEAIYADGEVVSNLSSVAGATVALHAKWAANSYTVQFAANGGEGAMAAQDFVYGKAQKLRGNAFTREGYTFDGWATNAAGAAVYAAGARVSNLTGEAGGEVSVYAAWAANTYTVSFDANGGEGAMAGQAFSYDARQTLASNQFTRTGYAFGGWSATPDGAAAYADGAEVVNLSAEADGAVTLYAVWNANAYTVHFDANGGEGSMDDQRFAYGAAARALSVNAFSRGGHVFEGWAESAGGVVAYADGAAVADLTAEADGVVTLYAVWAGGGYTVAFDANGGEGAMAAEKFVYGVARGLDQNAFARAGHVFDGWAASADGAVEFADGAVVSNLTATTGGEVTLYAKWKAVGYTVAFDANGGSGSMPARSYTYGEAAALPANVFTKAGHVFGGWAASAAGAAVYADGETVLNLASEEGATVTLHAKWTTVSYTVKFSANGGAGEVEAQTFVYGTAKKLRDNAFTRTGYTFGGWATNAAGAAAYAAGEAVSNLTETAGGKVTLYAKWNAAEYTVRFDANGGSGSMADEKFVYDTPRELPANAFVKEGHTFGGWATNSAGAAVYQNGASVKNLTAAAGGLVTLYAKWTANGYSVAFAANGGEGEMSPQSFVYGKPGKLAANAFSRTGYAFDGWATNAAGPVVYAGGATVSNLTDVAGGTTQLYAKWKGVAYTVKFAANGGTGAMADQQFEYGSAQRLRANAFTRSGYAFAGWAGSSAGAAVYANNAVVSNLASTAGAAVTLYAVWTVGECTVTFDPNGGRIVSGEAERTVAAGDELGEPPTAAKSDAAFAGWFTEPDGGDEVSGGTVVSEDSTFYAQWLPPRVTLKKNGGSGKCKVTGGGEYAVGDKVTLKATVPSGYVFGGWYENKACTTPLSTVANHRKTGVAYRMPAARQTIYARFATVAEDKAAVTATVGSMTFTAAAAKTPVTNALRGVSLEWPLDHAAISKTTVKVTGLPAGLEYDASAGAVKGTPTKAKTTTAKIAVTTAGKETVTFKLKIKVGELPEWALGNFTGAVIPADAAVAPAAATMSVTSKGKISGKFKLGGTNWTFSASSFSSASTVGGGRAVLVCRATAKATKNSRSFTCPLGFTLVRDAETSAIAARTEDGFFGGDGLEFRRDAGMSVRKNSGGTVALSAAYGQVAYKKNVKLTAKLSSGYAFLGWFDEDGKLLSQELVYKLKMLGVDRFITATFAKESELSKPLLKWGSPVKIPVGVAYSAKPSVSGDAAVKIASVSGLPKGLIWKNGEISGAPKKTGKFTVKLKVTLVTNAKKKWTLKKKLTVTALPDYVVGTFNGGLPGGIYSGARAGGVQAKITVGKTGAVSGKVAYSNAVWKASASSLSAATDGVFTVKLKLVKGSKTQKTTLLIVEGEFGGVAECTSFTAWQNVWKSTSAWKKRAKALDGVAFKDAASGVKVSFGANGTAKGTLKAGGVKFSGSTVLVPVETDGTAVAGEMYFRFAPDTGKKFKGRVVVVEYPAEK